MADNKDTLSTNFINGNGELVVIDTSAEEITSRWRALCRWCPKENKENKKMSKADELYFESEKIRRKAQMQKWNAACTRWFVWETTQYPNFCFGCKEGDNKEFWDKFDGKALLEFTKFPPTVPPDFVLKKYCWMTREEIEKTLVVARDNYLAAKDEFSFDVFSRWYKTVTLREPVYSPFQGACL